MTFSQLTALSLMAQGWRMIDTRGGQQTRALPPDGVDARPREFGSSAMRGLAAHGLVRGQVLDSGRRWIITARGRAESQ